jgi:hypothetical protein
LKRAGLTDALLEGADLTDACYDEHTEWSISFDPQRHGAVLIAQGCKRIR